jgi:hypothetical protein
MFECRQELQERFRGDNRLGPREAAEQESRRNVPESAEAGPFGQGHATRAGPTGPAAGPTQLKSGEHPGQDKRSELADQENSQEMISIYLIFCFKFNIFLYALFVNKMRVYIILKKEAFFDLCIFFQERFKLNIIRAMGNMVLLSFYIIII